MLDAKFLRGAALVGGIRVANVALTFVFFVVVARSMTIEGFGVFSVAYSIATIGAYISNIGQHVAVLRFLPTLGERHGADAEAALLRKSGLLVLMGGGAGVIALIAAGMVHPQLFLGELSNAVWAALLLFVVTLAEFTCNAMRARGAWLLALLPRDIVWRALVIVALLAWPKPASAPVTIAIVALCLLIPCLPQFVQLLVLVRRARSDALPVEAQKSWAKASKTLWLSTSITPLVDHTATIIVAAALGPAAAGLYFAADRLAKLLSITLVAAEQFGAPQIARSFHGGRMLEVRKLVRAITIAATSIAGVGIAGYALFGNVALGLFDKTYASAVPVLLILACGQLISASNGPCAALLNMAGGERQLLMIRGAWSVVLMTGVYWAARSFGVVGAAVVSSVVVAGWTTTASLVCRRAFAVSTSVFAVANTRKVDAVQAS